MANLLIKSIDDRLYEQIKLIIFETFIVSELVKSRFNQIS